jgi:hypothetical protein
MVTRSIQPPPDLSAFGPARATVQGSPLSAEELRKFDAYWRASLYLCLGMIYLRDNPLLEDPLQVAHTKARLLGHWGSDPGQSLVYLHPWFNHKHRALLGRWLGEGGGVPLHPRRVAGAAVAVAGGEGVGLPLWPLLQLPPEGACRSGRMGGFGTA